jgi:hypothetical protein
VITPEPNELTWSLTLRVSTFTTDFRTASATSAKPDSGGGAAPCFDSTTPELVNASATSAVLRPITPPLKPISRATIANIASET